MTPNDKPLTVTVSKGVLRIEIGVDTLAVAYLRSQHAWEAANPSRDGNLKPEHLFTIRPFGFAREVKRELLDEAEDGSNLLTRMLDTACAEAVEQGSQFFSGPDDDDR